MKVGNLSPTGEVFAVLPLLCRNAPSATFLPWQGIEVVEADSADSPPGYGWPFARPAS